MIEINERVNDRTLTLDAGETYSVRGFFRNTNRDLHIRAAGERLVGFQVGEEPERFLFRQALDRVKFYPDLVGRLLGQSLSFRRLNLSNDAPSIEEYKAMSEVAPGTKYKERFLVDTGQTSESVGLSLSPMLGVPLPHLTSESKMEEHFREVDIVFWNYTPRRILGLRDHEINIWELPAVLLPFDRVLVASEGEVREVPNYVLRRLRSD